MMTDGYEPWIAIAPEGKIPVRAGASADSTEYADAWAAMAGRCGHQGPALAVLRPGRHRRSDRGHRLTAAAGPSRRDRVTCSARSRASSRWPTPSTRSPMAPRPKTLRRRQPTRSARCRTRSDDQRCPRRGAGRGTGRGCARPRSPSGGGPPGPARTAGPATADHPDRRDRVHDGGAADPVDDLTGLPARAAAQPATHRFLRRLQPRQLRQRADLARVRRRAHHHARLLGGRHYLRNRARPGCGARAAQALPRARAGARLHAACRTSRLSSPRPSCGRRCSTRSSAS